MPRPAPSKVTPWIESLILNYGDHEEEEGGGSSSRGRLKAHVIGVGQMSLSQARCSDGPTGLLFLSDGVLQIPAVLTASAWEHLQEQEDRECFTSLVNTTVIIQNYRLQFHMNPEQTKCRFFLSVGELATTAAGPVKDNTPCCTTLPSVRVKICRTWRDLLGQEDSQKSQCGLDLSELLGEWQNDCLQAVLNDVREKLMPARHRAESSQPSTSTYSASSTSCATGFDLDRIRYKGEKCFTVPVHCLLMPEDDAEQGANAGTSTQTQMDGDLPQVCELPEPRVPFVDDADWQISMQMQAGVERVCDASETSPAPAEVLDVDIVTGMIDGPLSNPWDMFPPPCISSSSSEASPEASPILLQPSPTTAASRPDSVAMVASTQLPVHSSKDSSSFPPYQKQPSTFPGTSSSSNHMSPPEPPASDEHHNPTAQETLDNDRGDVEGAAQVNYRKPKRKRCEATPQAFTTVKEQEQLSGSPPSWLFDSQTGSSGTEDGSNPRQTGIETAPRRTPNTHSDGQPFSYSYKVSGQNLQDFSRFRVPASLLHWAVKYLVVPKKTDVLPNVT